MSQAFTPVDSGKRYQPMKGEAGCNSCYRCWVWYFSLHGMLGIEPWCSDNLNL